MRDAAPMAAKSTVGWNASDASPSARRLRWHLGALSRMERQVQVLRMLESRSEGATDEWRCARARDNPPVPLYPASEGKAVRKRGYPT